MRLPQRDVRDDAAVVEQSTVVLDGWEDGWDRRARQQRGSEQAAVDDVRARCRDVERDRREGHREVLERRRRAEVLGDDLRETAVREEVIVRALERDRLTDPAAREDAFARHRRPHGRQDVDRALGIARERRAVERSDGCTDHEVGDEMVLGERAQHADLDRAETAPAAQDEPHGARQARRVHGTVLPDRGQEPVVPVSDQSPYAIT